MHVLHATTRLVEYLEHLIAGGWRRHGPDDVNQLTLVTEFHEEQELSLTMVGFLLADGRCR